jgi:biotin carboxylase
MPRLLLLVPTATYRAEAFVRAAQRLDVDITIASDEPSSLEDFHPTALMTLDFTDLDRCATDVARFAQANPISAVVGVDDQVTLAASVIGEQLQLPHNPLKCAYATRNKAVMRDMLAQAGVPVPKFSKVRLDTVPSQSLDVPPYPCVAKPLMMAASRGVIRVDDGDALRAALRDIADIVIDDGTPADPESRTHALVEAYVPGWEVAVEGIVTDGRLHVFAIFDKPDPLEGPYFPETIYVTPSRLPRQAQTRIERTTQDAVSALGIAYGPVHAELRGDGERLWVIEVAARSIGGYCSRVLRFDGRLFLEDVIVRHAFDPTISIPPRERQAAGVMMLQAPEAGRFREVHGLGEAREVPGINEIIISAHPGQVLAPLPHGFLYAGFILACAQDSVQAEHALRDAFSCLTFDIA